MEPTDAGEAVAAAASIACSVFSVGSHFAVDGGVSNLCFGGEDGRTLLLLSETRAFAVRMRVRGALL